MAVTPTLFAYLALLGFVPIALVVCASARPARAATLLILGGTLLLPQRLAFDFPGLPSFHKESILYLSLLLGMLLGHAGLLARARPGRGPEAIVAVMIVGNFLTVLTNRDPLVYGPVFKPGLDLWGALAGSFEDVVRYALPFFLGRALVRSGADLLAILSWMAAAGLALTPLIAIELRLSPQLHNWVYGYLPGAFTEAVRWGGYRPMLFMESGISVGIFMATTVMAATILARLRKPIFTVPSRVAKYYLFVFLVLVKSVAAIVWGAVFVPLLSVASPRTLARVALCLVVFLAAYPSLRMSGLFPRERLVEVAEAVDADRARSLAGRFDSEDAMLEKWGERPWFGWGGYSRNWVYDPETGRNQTIPDGAWIIQVGSRGVVGLIPFLAIYLVPVWIACRRLPRVRDPRDRMLVAGTALIVLVRALDQLPNGFYMSFPIFLAGALYGTLPALSRPRASQPSRSTRRASASPASW